MCVVKSFCLIRHGSKVAGDDFFKNLFGIELFSCRPSIQVWLFFLGIYSAGLEFWNQSSCRPLWPGVFQFNTFVCVVFFGCLFSPSSFGNLFWTFSSCCLVTYKLFFSFHSSNSPWVYFLSPIHIYQPLCSGRIWHKVNF